MTKLTVQVDGYTVGDRLLEGVMFDVTFEAVSWTDVRVLTVEPATTTAKQYLSGLNAEKWMIAVKDAAEDGPDELYELLTDDEFAALEAEWGSPPAAQTGIEIPAQRVSDEP